jgi:tetratricopeptide (TPR) repeat protein
MLRTAVCLIFVIFLAQAPWAAKFRLLAYTDGYQMKEGVILSEDKVSYRILTKLGEREYAKKGVQVLHQDDEEDGDFLNKMDYTDMACGFYREVWREAKDKECRARLMKKMVGLCPRLKETKTLLSLSQLQPDSPEVQYWLAKAYIKEFLYDESVLAMEKAARLQPESIKYSLGLAEALLCTAHKAITDERNPDKALEILADVPYSASLVPTLRWMTESAFTERLLDLKQRDLIKHDPDLFAARYLVDTMHFALAGPYLMAASERRPNDPVVHNYLAHVLLRLGRDNDANLEIRDGDENPANHPPHIHQRERLAKIYRIYIEEQKRKKERLEFEKRQRELKKKLLSEKTEEIVEEEEATPELDEILITPK